jgi:putative ATPase
MSNKREPLAFRMAPRTLGEFVGQEHIIGPGKLLNRMIAADRISSIILYGPPGTGKTSIARLIARTTKATFQQLNAVTAGVKDIRQVVEEARNTFLNPTGRCVLFVDEIHRFNKSQQDALLPFVEDGTVVLIGATTENPYFEVNKALISRSTVFMLVPLETRHIARIIRAALEDTERGFGQLDIGMADEVVDLLANVSSGDARIALNALELAVLTSNFGGTGHLEITREVITDCVQKKAIRFDKSSEGHYDNISAMIKSMRGSDPDAALFYLARAIYAGEEPEFLARRIMICASEDVGMANPNALTVAVAAAQACMMIGMPEARILLAQAAVMVATSPKSNASYLGIDEALADVGAKDTGEVPMQLRNAVVSGMADLGYGKGYHYAHDDPRHLVDDMVYLPDKMAGTLYYRPSSNGYELKINDWLTKRRQKLGIVTGPDGSDKGEA